MKFKYMYMDESGDLGFKKGSSKFIIISALVVDDPRELARIIKNMRRNKFKKELKRATEIKANKSSSEVIVYMLQKLKDVKGAKIFHIVLEKSKIFSEYLLKDKNKLYNFIAGKLAKNVLMGDINLEIKIDKSKGNLFLRKDFDNYFKSKIKENCKEVMCKIEHSYSHSWEGLQFVDIIAWACFQKFEHNNEKYINEIKIEQEFYSMWN